MQAQSHHDDLAHQDGLAHDDDQDRAASVSAAVTIGKSANEVRSLWLDPATLPRIMEPMARITPRADHTADWEMDAPLGRTLHWRTRRPEETDRLGWTTVDGADVPNTGTLILRPAPGDRGTEVTLKLRFDPPGGLLGSGIARLFHVVPREMAMKALYNFRALALTGEVPTTEPQPAARNGGMDK